MSTYAPFAKPLYVMLKPVGADATLHATTVTTWKRANYTRTTQSM